MHPEEEAVAQWVRGRTVEIGCGSNPTPDVDVTADRTPGGTRGNAGSQSGQVSVAQIAAEMGALPFCDAAFDTLVARHLLEHHPDTITVLREWGRVADRLVVICPDQATHPGSTVALDPTHEAAFTPLQLHHLAEHAGLRVRHVGEVVPSWSFLLVAEEVPWQTPVTSYRSRRPNEQSGSAPSTTPTTTSWPRTSRPRAGSSTNGSAIPSH